MCEEHSCLLMCHRHLGSTLCQLSLLLDDCTATPTGERRALELKFSLCLGEETTGGKESVRGHRITPFPSHCLGLHNPGLSSRTTCTHHHLKSVPGMIPAALLLQVSCPQENTPVPPVGIPSPRQEPQTLAPSWAQRPRQVKASPGSSTCLQHPQSSRISVQRL